MNFVEFRDILREHFSGMQEGLLFKVDVDKTTLWDTYLNSFPEGTNPIYKERTHHDCQCCKQFIRTVGNVVCFVGGKPVSIWSAAVDCDTYGPVAEAMANLVENAAIREPFLHYQNKIGALESFSQAVSGEQNGTVLDRWEHFFVELLPAKIMPKDQIPSHLADLGSTKNVFKRALEEISMDSVDTVIELIDQNSLYRGEENRNTLVSFRTCLQSYALLETEHEKAFYLWEAASHMSRAVTKVRSSAIGTLLVDLSEGKGLDRAVGAFEAMVAPANYKRPKALITQGMIKKAQEKVEELGMLESLERRHAVPEDITVNNVLFANRNARKVMGGNVFDELVEDVAVDMQKLGKVEEVTIDNFIADILPNISSIEMLVENRLQGNFLSLVAPVHAEAPNMLKWDNNFSWAYHGDVTDSMKERVKAAGGKVDGVLRFSIQWNDDEEHNRCDYDAHCLEPGRNRIYYAQQTNPATSGRLDVDITNPTKGIPAVENITWSNKAIMELGEYRFTVHGYAIRAGNKGFSAEFEDNHGNIRQYEYAKGVGQDEHVAVVRGTWDGENFTVTEDLPSVLASRELWGVNTMQYVPVSMLMLSPNHWDDRAIGNKHWFFMLEGCKQPGPVRGFYNEFLDEQLREHRKVFEVLGSKMKAEESDHQLSGLGFSSTQRNHVFCKVSGNFNRTLKITF